MKALVSGGTGFIGSHLTEALIRKGVHFFRRPSLLNKDKAEEMIQKDWVCNITKAKTLLGFEPRVPLSERAKLTFEWYKKEKWL